MSFFRNIRSTITRGKSSSRDTTPVRSSTIVSRPGSTTASISTRRDSLESRTESLNRSDTFILDECEDKDRDSEDKSHSNSSTLEKKSKKSKVLSKFSTFTKRKKTPSPEHGAYEHHPSDNATNTYYKWQSDSGPSNLDYDSQTDPFNFLYEQQSSLKAMQSGSTSAEPTRAEIRGSSASAMFDSSTYRKSKVPTQLRERLEQLKTHATPDLHEEEPPELEGDKYKTITLNSLRRSFRDKFLQQQKDAAYNPSWFVEVQPPAEKEPQHEAKENRPDFLVFNNDNYRPGSRSPVRDNSGRSARSPVKRNETFRVERPVIDAYNSNSAATPSIRIEIKNSIAPNMPGRIVPVGVAKPMPSQYTTTAYNVLAPNTTSTRLNSSSPLRSWGKPVAALPTRNASAVNRSGRFQTLVQIRNDSNNNNNASSAMKFAPQSSTPLSARSRLASTRVQLGGASPITQKRLNTPSSRYSLSSPHATTFNSYELLKQSANKAQQQPNSAQVYAKSKQHTYFGGQEPSAPQIRQFASTAVGRTNGYSGSSVKTAATPVSRVQLPHQLPPQSYQQRQQQQQQQQQQQSRSSTTPITGCYYGRREQSHQSRVLVPTQRRSRSPIKMPWR